MVDDEIAGRFDFARRALFLGNALLSSDYAIDIYQERVSVALFPGLLPFLTCSDVDLRESALRLLTTLARMECGRKLMTENDKKPLLDAALATAQSRLQGLKDSDNEDDKQQSEFESQLISEYEQVLAGPAASLPPPVEDENTALAAPLLLQAAAFDTVISQ